MRILVNGEECHVPPKPTVRDILSAAAAKDACVSADQLGKYYLESWSATGRLRWEDLDDPVEARPDQLFIALHAGATPVA